MERGSRTGPGTRWATGPDCEEALTAAPHRYPCAASGPRLRCCAHSEGRRGNALQPPRPPRPQLLPAPQAESPVGGLASCIWAAAAPPRLHNSPPHGSEQQHRLFCSQICVWVAGRKGSSLLQGTSRGSLSGAGRPYTRLASWCRLPQGPQSATTWPLRGCLGFLAA